MGKYYAIDADSLAAEQDKYAKSFESLMSKYNDKLADQYKSPEPVAPVAPAPAEPTPAEPTASGVTNSRLAEQYVTANTSMHDPAMGGGVKAEAFKTDPTFKDLSQQGKMELAEKSMAQAREAMTKAGVPAASISTTISAMRKGYVANIGAVPERGLGEMYADSMLRQAKGVLGSVKSLTDIAGTDNPVSHALEKGVTKLGALSSDAAKDNVKYAQEQSQALGANASLLDKAALTAKQFGHDPIGSVSELAGGAIPFVAGGGAGMGIRSLAALSALMGAGGVKGAIYDSIKGASEAELMADPKYKTLLEHGTPAQAREALAVAKQSYGDSAGGTAGIVAGGLVGAAAGYLGPLQQMAAHLGKSFSKETLKKIVADNWGATIAKEAAVQGVVGGVQSGSTAALGNVGAASGGADIPLKRGVVEGTTHGAIGGGLMGAGAGHVMRGQGLLQEQARLAQEAAIPTPSEARTRTDYSKQRPGSTYDANEPDSGPQRALSGPPPEPIDPNAPRVAGTVDTPEAPPTSSQTADAARTAYPDPYTHQYEQMGVPKEKLGEMVHVLQEDGSTKEVPLGQIDPAHFEEVVGLPLSAIFDGATDTVPARAANANQVDATPPYADPPSAPFQPNEPAPVAPAAKPPVEMANAKGDKVTPEELPALHQAAADLVANLEASLGAAEAPVVKPPVAAPPVVKPVKLAAKLAPAGEGVIRGFPVITDVPPVGFGAGGLVTPVAIAKGKHLYQEVSPENLNGLLGDDLGVGTHGGGMFVTDNRDLALGQGTNKGVLVAFRPDSLSGQEHKKPGTGDLAGREYTVDITAPRALQSIEMDSTAVPKLRGLSKRVLADFTRTDLDGGRVRFDRKGLDVLAYEPRITPMAKPAKLAPAGKKKVSDGEVNADTRTSADAPGREGQAAPVEGAGNTETVAGQKVGAAAGVGVDLQQPAGAGRKAEESAGRSGPSTEGTESGVIARSEFAGNRLSKPTKETKLEKATKTKAAMREQAATAWEASDGFTKHGVAFDELPALSQNVWIDAVADKYADSAESTRLAKGAKSLKPSEKIKAQNELDLARSKQDAVPTAKELAAQVDTPAPAKKAAPATKLAPVEKPAEAVAEKPAEVATTTVAEKAPHSETALGHATDLGGTVVYEKGDTGLVRGYSVLGGTPVYSAFKGSSRTRVDVDTYTGKMFTPEELADLKQAKQRAEAQDAAVHAATPHITYDVNGNSFSSSIPANIRGVANELKKMLGITTPIHFTLTSDIAQDRANYTGPHRAIGSLALDGREAGSVQRLADGTYAIAYVGKGGVSAQIEVLAHELGHIHERAYFDKQPIELQQEIRAAHKAWLAENQSGSAADLVSNLRAKNMGRSTVRNMDGTLSAEKLSPYWKSFSEWYADQVSRWAVSSTAGTTAVEKFFARLGAAMRRFYNYAKSKGYLPSETMQSYLDKVAAADRTSTWESARAPEPPQAPEAKLSMATRPNEEPKPASSTLADSGFVKKAFGRLDNSPRKPGESIGDYAAREQLVAGRNELLAQTLARRPGEAISNWLARKFVAYTQPIIVAERGFAVYNDKGVFLDGFYNEAEAKALQAKHPGSRIDTQASVFPADQSLARASEVLGNKIADRARIDNHQLIKPIVTKLQAYAKEQAATQTGGHAAAMFVINRVANALRALEVNESGRREFTPLTEAAEAKRRAILDAVMQKKIAPATGWRALKTLTDNSANRALDHDGQPLPLREEHSGVSDAAAQEVVDGFPAAVKFLTETARPELDALRARNREIAIQSLQFDARGLALVDMRAQKNYFPLYGKDGGALVDVPRGMATTESVTLHTAEGRKGWAHDPFYALLADNAAHHSRVAEMERGQMLQRFVFQSFHKNNPVAQAKAQAFLDKAGIRYEKSDVLDALNQSRNANEATQGGSKTLIVRKLVANGDGKVQQMHLTVNEDINKGQDGTNFIAAWAGSNIAKPPGVLDIANTITRTVSGGVTHYNPKFAPYDLVRTNIMFDQLLGGDFGAHVLPTFAKAALTYHPVAIMKAMAGAADANPAVVSLVNRLRAAGYLTQFYEAHGMKRTAKLVKMQLGRENVQKVLDAVEMYNEAFEWAPRVSAVAALMEHGVDFDTAGVWSLKSANFSMHGEWTPWVRPFVMFVNPGAQGMRRMAEVKNQATSGNSRTHAMLAISIAAGGALYMLSNSLLKQDDEGTDILAKQSAGRAYRGLQVPNPMGGNLLTMPYPIDTGLIVGLGTALARVYLGHVTAKEAVVEWMQEALQRLSPLEVKNYRGALVELLAMFSGGLRPLVEVGFNQSGLGTPISNDHSQTHRLAAIDGREGTPHAYKAVMEALSKVPYVNHMSPEDLQHVFTNYFQPLTEQIDSLLYALDDTLPARKNKMAAVPVIGRFFVDKPESDTRYYDMYNNAQDQYDALNNKDPEKKEAARAADPKAAATADLWAETDKANRAQAKEDSASGRTPKDKKAEVLEKRNRIHDDFIRRYKEINK